MLWPSGAFLFVDFRSTAEKETSVSDSFHNGCDYVELVQPIDQCILNVVI